MKAFPPRRGGERDAAFGAEDKMIVQREVGGGHGKRMVQGRRWSVSLTIGLTRDFSAGPPGRGNGFDAGGVMGRMARDAARVWRNGGKQCWGGCQDSCMPAL
jgi:hypothetical protein